MKRTTVFLAGIAICVASSAYALYEVSFEGTWPKSWPKELEPLRKQARTLEGPLPPDDRHYAIRFTNRDEFESAWPYILKLKSQGASIHLVRAPNFSLGEKNKAGVVVHCPPADQEEPGATKDRGATNGKGRGINSTYIELVVDGEIVDLNRIPLPADTPISDERFKDGKKK